MRDEALRLLELGYSVIPLVPGSKRAMLPWSEYQRRLPTPDEVTGWWTLTPDANIGLVTGAVSGLLVMDIDPRNGGDLALAEPWGDHATIVGTGGGGLHVYFRHPGGRITSHPTGTPGVDLKADGGYVVAPPSIHESGHHYTLVRPWRQASEQPDAPEWLLAPPVALGSQQQGVKWVAQTMAEGAPIGEQHRTLVRLAGYFANRGMPLDVTEGVLWGWIQGCPQQAGRPWLPAHVSKVTTDIYRRHQARPMERSVTFEDDSDYVIDRLHLETHGPVELPVISLGEFLDEFTTEPQPWLIPGWVPDSTVGFIVSPPGMFKTWLTFDLAASVAGARPFLGTEPVSNPGPVLVLQQEDAYEEIAVRFMRIWNTRRENRGLLIDEQDAMLFERGDALPPVYLSTSRGFKADRDHLRALERVIKRLRPRLVVIDPLYSITTTDDFMRSAATDLFPLKTLRDVYGCSFLVVAHTAKHAGPGREALWGSQFLNAFIETGIHLRREDEKVNNEIVVRRHTKSAAPPDPVTLTFHITPEDYRVEIGPYPKPVELDETGKAAA
jgi:hypothetical protein